MPKYRISWEVVDCYKIIVEAPSADHAMDMYWDGKIEDPDPHYSENAGETEIEEVDESMLASPIKPLETETADDH